MKLLQRFNHPTSQICRTGSRNFSKTTKLYAAVPDNCKQPMKKSSKVHLEAKKSCQSFLECGPCSKFKYMDIVCKIALVTGGGSSIGFAIANELLCQNAHKVLIAHPNVEIGIKAVEALENVYGKDKACYIPLDFQKSEEFEEIFKIMHGKFGGIDILVNNTWPLNDYKWEHDVDANLFSNQGLRM
ncbi:unnamed protein product [Nezara viridula]|uniref:Uncharacterized protein n=1 Tax=Nezara viridula TaxID=85310 RepID=A0A9P0HCK7_NEZVI|nr:unnamed protein product [Nezara viridula]